MAKPPKTKSPPRTVALYDQHLGLVLDERYRILAPLGDGVLTTVYSAEHVTLGTRYAVAFLKEEFADQKTVVEAFLNRAKSQPRLSGVHVLSALDFGVAPSGEPYVVKEYGEGETLGDFVKRHGTLTPRRAVALIRQLALVLQELGGEGHRNLKPHNIKVSSEGELLALMDFGHIALHSSAVPRLDPWELWLHKKPELNDVTALSLFAFFLITGRLPERSEFTIPVGEYAPDEQEAFARLERLYSIGRQVVSPGEATMESIVGLLGSDAIPKEP
ncbi:protein kinase, partial [Myxococcota bacterium]|nr:protein kinase [Myxococcota bacterium]MBU1534759.1 protein kinase [Myxococcota bacterium]